MADVYCDNCRYMDPDPFCGDNARCQSDDSKVTVKTWRKLIVSYNSICKNENANNDCADYVAK